MIILFKYYADVENCESFRGFGYIYIYIYIYIYVYTHTHTHTHIYNIQLTQNLTCALRA